jgi:hypothetical protein
MEVKSTSSQENSSTKEKSFAASAKVDVSYRGAALKVSVSGSVSYSTKDTSSFKQHYTAQNSAKYSVHVHAGQIPLPKGVNLIIEAYSKNIAPFELTAPAGSGDGGAPKQG